MKVRKVENPPLRTAGPILVNVASILWALRKEFMRFSYVQILSYLSPGVARNLWPIWTEKSTQRPTAMTRVLQEMISKVRPQKCINPATSMMVTPTHRMTMIEHRRLQRKMRTVMNIATNEHPIFW